MATDDEEVLVRVWREAVESLSVMQERMTAANRAELDARNNLALAKKNESIAWDALSQFRENQLG